MVTDEDFLLLAKELLLMIVDLQAENGTIRLAVQRHGITLEELNAARAELERRIPLEKRRSEIRALGQKSVLQFLRDFRGTLQ